VTWIPKSAPKPKKGRSGRKPSPQRKKSQLKSRGKRTRKSKGQLFHGAKFRDADYIAWIRKQPCVILHRYGHVIKRGAFWYVAHFCASPVQACHLTSRGAGGSDRGGNVVSMCAILHDQQHTQGLESFQKNWGVDLRAEALRLQALYESEHPHNA
jgi:hypothetical protein